MAEDGMYAAIQRSKRDERPALLDGYKRIPGASRSGALDPQTRSRMLSQETAGLIELQRDQYGQLIGYRTREKFSDSETNRA
ncbi:hypothetical protein [Aeromicrobium sp. JJY06]|uniref:hypothetical protein n=1 Tax=Aeromicrobium sp. JJY06 TaxID=3373478 RepID=UPI00376EF195